VDDRLLPPADWDSRGAWTEQRNRPRGRGTDAGGNVQISGLRHRLFWQMAPRPSPAYFADEPRVRYLFRDPLQQRYVAAAPGERGANAAESWRSVELAAATAAAQRRGGRSHGGQSEHATGRPTADDSSVHRAGDRLHPPVSGAAVFCLFA